MKIPKPTDPEDESAWRAFFKACQRHHESLRGRVPEHALALVKLKGVDDGLLVEADYNRAERTLKNGRRNAFTAGASYDTEEVQRCIVGKHGCG